MLIKTDFNEIISLALSRYGQPKQIESIDSYDDKINVSLIIHSVVGNHAVNIKLRYNNYHDSVLSFDIISGLGPSILAKSLAKIISKFLPLGVWVEGDLFKMNPNEILEDKNAQMWVNNIWMEENSLFIEMAYAV